MRTFGLIFLLAGCLLWLAPGFFGYIHRYYHFQAGPVLGSALLCLGVAALFFSRDRA